jgi:CheY-like chemotaxis protein
MTEGGAMTTATIPRIFAEPVLPRVLVIEDDVVLARAVGRMLRAYDTTVETDPCAAVARIRNGEHFDIVMTDMKMPGMTGVEVLQAIRSHFAGRAGMPQIIVMSGSDELSADELDTQVLLKPYYQIELRTMVNRLLESRLT